MRSYILKGSQIEKEKYIEDFIKNYSILPYNIYKYSDSLKIAEAREIKKSISIASNGKRLFVINESPAIEAQNALLKTLEELPEDTDFIFLNGSELLPTIISRSSIVQLARGSINKNDEYDEIIKKFIDNGLSNLSSAIVLTDSLLALDPEVTIFQQSLRNVLIRYLTEDKVREARTTHSILRNFLTMYPLIVNNNLNKRLALERIILDSLASI